MTNEGDPLLRFDVPIGRDKVVVTAPRSAVRALLAHPTVVKAKAKYDRGLVTKSFGAQWKREKKGGRP